MIISAISRGRRLTGDGGETEVLRSKALSELRPELGAKFVWQAVQFLSSDRGQTVSNK